MIERYSLTSLDDIPEVFGVVAPAGPPRFNIAPLQIAWACTAQGLVAARWGLLPPWRGHGGKRGPHILHAPLEALDQVPVLRNAFRSQRCLVIADGFYLWWRAGRKSQPMWLHPVADPARRHARTRTIAFAGVAATHRDDGQPSFAVIVGPASPLVAPYDSTMPVVIPPDGYPAWLTGPRDRAIARLTDALAGPTGWRAEPVSTWVNSVDHDDARCIEPLGNPDQGELF
jgi:putative SOS response-associated peptidase YedK